MLIALKGREYGYDFQLSDLSVSRLHAEIVVTKDRVLLRDKESRFGTMLMRTQGFKLTEFVKKSPWYQVGRTIMRFKLKKPWLKVFPWLTYCNFFFFREILIVFF